MRRVHLAAAALLALSLRPALAGEEYPAPVARPIVSSPSGNDHGTNSNYPLDPRHTVFVMNGGIAQPNGGNAPVQSAASLPRGFTNDPAMLRDTFATMPAAPGG